MGRIAYIPPLLYGDVYTSSERHVCYTLRRGCSYAEAVYTTPGNRRQGWEHLAAPATCLGAPRITVMDSVCILIYVSMYLCIYIATHLHTQYLDWLRSAEYILPFTLSTSVTPLIERVWDALGDGDWVNSEMHLEAVIERVWRCTWRLRSSELRDALGGRDRASLEMHLETEIEWTQRCTWRPGSSKFGDALGGHDHANLQAVIERVWRYTWKPWSSEFGDELGGRDRASLEMHLEAMIERVWRYTWRPWLSEIGRVLGGGRWTARRDSIHQIVNSQPWECDKVTLPLKLLWRTGWWRSIGREVRRKLKIHSGVNSKSWEWRDDRQS